MRRAIVVILLVLTILLGVYFFNSYWIHRYDALIKTQASIYRVDPDLVWSIIYEETYCSPWKLGKDGENPFIDPAGFRAHIDLKEKQFEAELERQKKAKPANE